MEKDEIQKQLDELPDKAANALLEWRRATICRETLESQLFLKFKKERISAGAAAGDDYIKQMVRATQERQEVCNIEATAEACYYRLNERHLSNKKSAGIRTAY